MRAPTFLWAWLWAAACCPPSLAASIEPISLPWVSRPPYQYAAPNGEVAGIIADLGREIFRKADVPYRWELVPALRINRSLYQGNDAFCMVGWFKTVEREQVAWFSEPIRRDPPLQMAWRAGAPFADVDSMGALVASEARVLVKAGYSYGERADRMIRAKAQIRAHTVMQVTSDHPAMLKMVALGRADVMLGPAEELRYLMGAIPGVEMRELKDEPEGNLRYLICSRAVSPVLRERLNRAIRELRLVGHE